MHIEHIQQHAGRGRPGPPRSLLTRTGPVQFSERALVRRHVQTLTRYRQAATHLRAASGTASLVKDCRLYLTFTENRLLCLLLQHREVLQQRKHIRRRFLQREERLQPGEHERRKLARRQYLRDGEYVRQYIWQQLCIFHLPHIVNRRIRPQKERSLTSSSSDGRILRVRRPSEKRSSTLVSPFMNEIFSSRVFAAKFERSRKLSVDIGNEEKNGCEGRAEGDGRLCVCRVIRALRRTVRKCSVMEKPEGDVSRCAYHGDLGRAAPSPSAACRRFRAASRCCRGS